MGVGASGEAPIESSAPLTSAARSTPHGNDAQLPQNESTSELRSSCESSHRPAMTSRAKMRRKEPEAALDGELWQTVSQLAAANQQLATAHNRSLEQCQALLAEMLNGRAAAKATSPCPHCRAGARVVSTAKTRFVSPRKQPRRRKKAPAALETGQAAEELRAELDQLRAFKSTAQKTNEELTRDVERQRLLIERLRQELAEAAERLQLAQDSREAAETFQSERASSQEEEAAEVEEDKKEEEEEDALAEFRRELGLRREARQRALGAISSEMGRLRSELEAERLAHSETARLLEGLRGPRSEPEEEPGRAEALRLLDLLKVSDEASLGLRLQLERAEELRLQLESGGEGQPRAAALARLAEEARAGLLARRARTSGLKDRLAQLLARLPEGPRLRLLADSDDIRREAEGQLEDIARARQIADERARLLAELAGQAARQLADLKIDLASLSRERQALEEELRRAEDKVDRQDTEMLSLESQLGLARADCRELQNQMSLINSLFSQMLLGASSADMDLDRLTRLLQENHDLISGMAREKGTEAAALPKLLLDIVEQVDGRAREASSDERRQDDDRQEESIAHNLPKVWRILMELLSCQASAAELPSSAESASPSASVALDTAPDSCYKSVDTPTGPRLVISVSKTYIRLKELILEKKHLEKEMNRMKQLNTHLETKLSEQEKRLSTVSDELSKTWNIVGRMQAQHQQLHTHEKILRYELQQKRKMLQELKQELEYCREKWESARQKNTNTEIEWKSLRREFAARKALVSHAGAFSNSGESGFSDEREEESDEEEDRDIGKRLRSRRRSKKDGARPMSPDTESEQPTDTELSESKASSSSTTSGQQTPAPEAEPTPTAAAAAEPPPGPTADGDADDKGVACDASGAAERGELLHPLDKALARVIENLLETEAAGPSSQGPSSGAIFSIGPVPARAQTEARSPSGGRCEFGAAPREERGAPSCSAAAAEQQASLDARAARLKSLEEQAQWLVKKVSDTNRRGSALSSRLEELHEAYGAAPAAPPMPDVLPAFRLRSELPDAADDHEEASEQPINHD